MSLLIDKIRHGYYSLAHLFGTHWKDGVDVKSAKEISINEFSEIIETGEVIGKINMGVTSLWEIKQADDKQVVLVESLDGKYARVQV